MYRTLTHSGGRKLNKAKIGHFVFYISLLIIPILHFFIFYLYVNINSFVMAFQHYSQDSVTQQITISFVGFDNFKVAWEAITKYPYTMRNSFIFIAIDLFISQPLAILASYYIYKKKPGSAFFRAVLYLPQVLSGIILGVIFKFMIGTALPALLDQVFNVHILSPIDNPDAQLWVMMLFTITMSFGVNVLLYANAMGNVNPANIESASLDGANTIQILWHVVLPKIYPTIVSLAIVILSQVFTSQFQVFNVYGEDAGQLQNVGYFIYITSLKSSLLGFDGYISYTELSALGLSLTAIIVPVVFLTRFLMNRFGPKED